MPRIALALEYDGGAYRGWQAQATAPSIQAEVERALSFVADCPIAVVSAGRTDAGVHATMQIVHFDAPVDRGTRGWVLGASAELPPDIAVLWAQYVPDDFHARYSALARSYRYLILNRQVRPALERSRVCWARKPLDAAVMHAAAQCLLGERDFSSFRAAECQSRTPMRRMERIDVQRVGDYLTVTVTANAFLHHMVRNIVGVLLAIGAGDRPVHWAQDVLMARDRRAGGITAPPQGLYLAAVRYPVELALPSEPPFGYAAALLPSERGPRIDARGS